MPPLRCELHLRVGADLVREPWNTAARLAATGNAEAAGAVDGALELGSGDDALCRADFWDHLDGLLVAWLEATASLHAGASETIVTFPDTRIEAELRADGTDVHVAYEDVDARIPRVELDAALRSAAQRLLDALGPVTPNLRALAAHIDREEP